MNGRKIELLVSLGNWIQEEPAPLEMAMLKSRNENPWFDLKHQRMALEAIRKQFLQAEALEEFVASYAGGAVPDPVEVGVIFAGNLPLVGFHDFLCLYLSPHRGQIKCSSKDPYLFPALYEQLTNWDPELADRIRIVDRLRDVEAVIATGSGSANKYFEYYFGHLPTLLRGHRNAIAVIDEEWTERDFESLGLDVFAYYGLGCRSVAQLWLPANMEPKDLYPYFEDYKYVMENSKYQNNYQYNLAGGLLNREDFLTNDFLIMKESDQIHSRIACLHWKQYDDTQEVNRFIDDHRKDIQVVVGKKEFPVASVEPGNTQHPGLFDYADRKDSMQFLLELHKKEK